MFKYLTDTSLFLISIYDISAIQKGGIKMALLLSRD